MRIEIQVYNTTINDKIFNISAPDIDSAIAELGSLERAMKSYICLWCKEPTHEHDFCCDECSEHYYYDLQVNHPEDEQGTEN